jgi:hypothetical protein
MSIQQKIDRELMNRRMSEMAQPVYLSAEDFRAFIEEIMPLYRARYGGLVSSADCPEFQNILYRGAPICVK